MHFIHFLHARNFTFSSYPWMDGCWITPSLRMWLGHTTAQMGEWMAIGIYIFRSIIQIRSIVCGRCSASCPYSSHHLRKWWVMFEFEAPCCRWITTGIAGSMKHNCVLLCMFLQGNNDPCCTGRAISAGWHLEMQCRLAFQGTIFTPPRFHAFCCHCLNAWASWSCPRAHQQTANCWGSWCPLFPNDDTNHPPPVRKTMHQGQQNKSQKHSVNLSINVN